MINKPDQKDFRLNENHERRNAEILEQVKKMRSKVTVREALEQYDRIKKQSNRYSTPDERTNDSTPLAEP
jgi:hypothetical protein